MHPKIRFKTKSKKDVETFFCFARDAKYDNGRSFNRAVLKHYSFFKKFKIKNDYIIKKEIVEKFVREFYQKNEAIIEKNLNLYEKNPKS